MDATTEACLNLRPVTQCAFCQEDGNVYRLGDGSWICVEHIGLVVTLAANDIFVGEVSYTKAFENVLLW